MESSRLSGARCRSRVKGNVDRRWKKETTKMLCGDSCVKAGVMLMNDREHVDQRWNAVWIKHEV